MYIVLYIDSSEPPSTLPLEGEPVVATGRHQRSANPLCEKEKCPWPLF